MRSTFQPGTGVYTCVECGKKTRDTRIGEASAKMCAKCFEASMIENSLNDGDISHEEYMMAMAELEERYQK